MIRPILTGLMFLINAFVLAASPPVNLYQWALDPELEKSRIEDAETRLNDAILNPEYVLNSWIDLPTSPQANLKKRQRLTLREAILLALRYNVNIKNAELDRIVQRYQLRLAQNEFELQYALAGSVVIEKSHYSDVGDTTIKNYVATPELDLKTMLGSKVSLNLDNHVASYNSYTPVLNFSFRQPLLRGFGPAVNGASLRDSIDNECLNKLGLRQSVIDQVTKVIAVYRALVLSGNNLENQKRQLDDAFKSYKINEKKIEAGQLEPTGNIQQAYQIESLRLMVEQAENEFNTTTQDLLQTIGLDPSMSLSVPSDVQLKKLVVPDEKQTVEKALAQNLDFARAKMVVRADERAYQVAKNQQLWQLDLGANVQSGRVADVDGNAGIAGIYNGRNINQSAQVTLTIPLHDIERRNQLINAKIRLEKDRLNLLATKRALITSIKNSITTIRSQASRYALAERQVKLARESYELEKKKQAAGIATALNVNNTQNQLLQAQMALITTKIAYLNQMSMLEQMLGTTLEQWDITLRYGE